MVFSQKKDFSFNIKFFFYAVVTFLIFLMLFLYLCGHAHFPFAAKINVLNYFNLLNEFNSNKVKMDYLLQAIYFIDEKGKKRKKVGKMNEIAVLFTQVVVCSSTRIVFVIEFLLHYSCNNGVVMRIISNDN